MRVEKLENVERVVIKNPKSYCFRETYTRNGSSFIARFTTSGGGLHYEVDAPMKDGCISEKDLVEYINKLGKDKDIEIYLYTFKD